MFVNTDLDLMNNVRNHPVDKPSTVENTLSVIMGGGLYFTGKGVKVTAFREITYFTKADNQYWYVYHGGHVGRHFTTNNSMGVAGNVTAEMLRQSVYSAEVLTLTALKRMSNEGLNPGMRAKSKRRR